ncbi:uncharacterized protein LOC111385446 [Olea europaea var. sylvestris]|uniref:uncharacterized protein LOC111385446 n=1 Tax=Olea europaea var. sylvestris TaxID=158386 RepID=UPI000C1CD237|nr:uncharacterized protein LOC111385446 [Olea europaea var. sylvestris]
MKGILRFGKKGKLSPRFIGPFEILEKIGNVAYHLALPLKLSAVHVFHVSILRKYISNPNHVSKPSGVDIVRVRPLGKGRRHFSQVSRLLKQLELCYDMNDMVILVQMIWYELLPVSKDIRWIWDMF